MDQPRELMLYPDRCTGCMNCLLACSFHHTGVFGCCNVSIRVQVRGKDRKTDIQVVREDGTKENRYACDCCTGEEVPFCVKYCSVKAITVRGAE